jgi:hypothetical protein
LPFGKRPNKTPNIIPDNTPAITALCKSCITGLGGTISLVKKNKAKINSVIQTPNIIPAVSLFLIMVLMQLTVIFINIILIENAFQMQGCLAWSNK